MTRKKYNERLNTLALIAFRKMGLDIKLDGWRDYTETFESFLEDELDKLRSRMEQGASELSDEQRDKLYDDHYIDDARRLDEVFPAQLRSSLFVACYSFLEDELVQLCELIDKLVNKGFDATTIRERIWL